MMQKSAENILQLRCDYTSDDVQAAFRKLAKESHPDTAGMPGHGHPLGVLKGARDTLLKIKKAEEAYENCATCRGTGQRPVTGSFGTARCGPCAGTGKVRKT